MEEEIKPKKEKKYKRNQVQLSKEDFNKNNDPRKPFWNEKGYWDKNGKYRSRHMNDRSPRQRKKCGAKCKTGEPCKKWAMKNGRCPRHGGKNVTKYHKRGADPVGDKETIWHDLLTEEEEVFLDELKLDAEILLNEEIKLITVRERRMLQRINKLSTRNFTITTKTKESETGTSAGFSINKVKTTETAESTLGQIQKIEDALTKVQEKKAKLIELKIKIQDFDDEDDSALDGLVAVIRSSKKRIRKAKETSDKQLGVD